jgi:hypothetical protein
MPAGRSNRIVIDVDNGDLKRRMYSALAEDGRSLKEWFTAAATDYLDRRGYAPRRALPVLGVAEPVSTYGTAGALSRSSGNDRAASKRVSEGGPLSRPRQRGRSRS